MDIAPLYALHHNHQLIDLFLTYDAAFEVAVGYGWIDFTIVKI